MRTRFSPHPRRRNGSRIDPGGVRTGVGAHTRAPWASRTPFSIPSRSSVRCHRMSRSRSHASTSSTSRPVLPRRQSPGRRLLAVLGGDDAIAALRGASDAGWEGQSGHVADFECCGWVPAVTAGRRSRRAKHCDHRRQLDAIIEVRRGDSPIIRRAHDIERARARVERVCSSRARGPTSSRTDRCRRLGPGRRATKRRRSITSCTIGRTATATSRRSTLHTGCPMRSRVGGEDERPRLMSTSRMRHSRHC